MIENDLRQKELSVPVGYKVEDMAISKELRLEMEIRSMGEI